MWIYFSSDNFVKCILFWLALPTCWIIAQTPMWSCSQTSIYYVWSYFSSDNSLKLRVFWPALPTRWIIAQTIMCWYKHKIWWVHTIFSFLSLSIHSTTAFLIPTLLSLSLNLFLSLSLSLSLSIIHFLVYAVLSWAEECKYSHGLNIYHRFAIEYT